MNKSVHCLVVRHALPALEPKDNPGIVPSEVTKIDGTGWVLSTILEDEDVGQATIFCSPARRAIETADALAKTEWLKTYLLDATKQTPELAESVLEQLNTQDMSLLWNPIMSRLASLALSTSSESEIPTLILVTHEPVIKSMPYLRNPNTDHLSINEFRTDIV